MSDECHSKEGESFVVLAIIFLIIFIVATVTFSVYLFIDLTHVTNIAGVHITKNLLMATNRAQGKLYSDEQNGIKDWIVYSDRRNGFEIKYPNEYVLQEINDGGNHVIVLKKNNDSAKGTDSLASAVRVNIKEIGDRASLKEEVLKMGIAWNDDWKQQDFGGKSGIRMRGVRDSSGAPKEMVVWQFGGKIFSLEMTCFNSDSHEVLALFDKIVSEFKFI